MSISKQLNQQLTQASIEFRVIKHARTSNPIQSANISQLPLPQFLQPLMFKTEQGENLMVVVPLNCVIDFHQLNRIINQPVRPLSRQELFLLFSDCECGAYSPISQLHAVKVILDTRVGLLSEVFFQAGSHTDVLCLSGKNFKQLHVSATWANIAQDDSKIDTSHLHRFTAAQREPKKSGCLTVDCEIKKRFEQMYQAPAIPDDLKEATDPSVCLQLSKVFDVGLEGPLGLKSFWRHATYNAQLSLLLAEKITPAVDHKRVYQSGLLHNIGFLLFGHLFKPEFQLLNKLVQANPNTPISFLEKHAIGMGQAKHVLGMGHGHLGAWLMKSWNMPEEMIIAQQEHHSHDYTGKHWEYAAITLVANHLLKRVNIGDADSVELPGELMSRLGLTEKMASDLLFEMLEQATDLDLQASKSAA